MTQLGHRNALWPRALAVLAVSVVLALPVMVHHYQQANAPTPPVWPVPEDPVAARKARMINQLLPLIQASNASLMQDRARLQGLRDASADGRKLKRRDMSWLSKQAEQYRLDPPLDNPPDGQFLAILERRLDLIPASLALAQAAMESAWGTSRFAREGNNYFGQWCFSKGCGIVPARRASGARHEVARFRSARQSVARYMLNLNSHPRYQQLRIMRQRQRAEGQEPDGYALAAGLEGYSGIGDEYVRALRALIRSNQLDRFPSL